MTIRKALAASGACDEQVVWLLGADPVARQLLAFYEGALAALHPSDQSVIVARLAKSPPAQIEATLHELLTHELLRRLDLDPVWCPTVQGLTPDLSFTAGGLRFLADVFVTHSPSRTLLDHGDWGEAWDFEIASESRAKKIADTVEKKVEKYARLPGEQLVLFVYLGDKRILSPGSAEQALFGMTVREAALEPAYQAPCAAPGYRWAECWWTGTSPRFATPRSPRSSSATGLTP